MREEFPSVEFVERPDLADWGHDKRSHGLQSASEDFVGFFNDDDRYSDDFIEKMLAVSTEQDVVYCGWDKIPDCGFWGCSSTSGNFIVRSEFGRRVGYLARDYIADATFINALVEGGARVTRVDEILYFHNGGVQRGAMA